MCAPATQVAADALLAVASQLTSAQSALAERLVGRGDVPEHHAPDAVFQVHCLELQAPG